jgi:hypothetical protein
MLEKFTLYDVTRNSVFEKDAMRLATQLSEVVRHFSQMAGAAGADVTQTKGVLLHLMAIAMVETAQGDMAEIEWYLRKARQDKTMVELQAMRPQ